MKLALCLHGATVAPPGLGLHPTDRRAIAMGAALGATIVVVEAVRERGSAPVAVSAALGTGAHRAVRIVDPALGQADAHAAGFALATAIHHLAVDLVFFGADADPEGLTDVPACIAHHMTALYLTGAINLAPSSPDAETVDVTVRGAGRIRRLAVPMNAVIGIAAGAPGDDVHPPRPAAVPPASVEVLSLADLGVDPALVRRRDDLRGAVESAPRALVSLQSAASVAALLRPA